MEFLKHFFGFSHIVQSKFIASFFVIIFLFIVRRIILIIVSRSVRNIKVHYRWRKTSAYISFGIGFFTIGRIWFEGFSSITTYLGLVSAGIAIAMQVPLVNLAGWAFIMWRRPFTVGDRIQVAEYRGDVIDQRIFMFTLMEIGNWVDADQSTGRVIHVPNGKIFTDALANYSKGFHYIWHEIPVLVTFESDWKKAKELLSIIAKNYGEHLSESAQKRIKQASKKYMIFYSKLTSNVYTTVKDSGVLLTIRFLCDPRQRRGREMEVWEHILEEFAKHDDIDFAYPTQRYYYNASEGKEGTKPDKQSNLKT